MGSQKNVAAMSASDAVATRAEISIELPPDGASAMPEVTSPTLKSPPGSGSPNRRKTLAPSLSPSFRDRRASGTASPMSARPPFEEEDDDEYERTDIVEMVRECNERAAATAESVTAMRGELSSLKQRIDGLQALVRGMVALAQARAAFPSGGGAAPLGVGGAHVSASAAAAMTISGDVESMPPLSRASSSPAPFVAFATPTADDDAASTESARAIRPALSESAVGSVTKKKRMSVAFVGVDAKEVHSDGEPTPGDTPLSMLPSAPFPMPAIDATLASAGPQLRRRRVKWTPERKAAVAAPTAATLTVTKPPTPSLR